MFVSSPNCKDMTTHPSPSIQSLSEKKLIGKNMTMSYADNKTAELWKSFMPVKNEIRNRSSNEMFSMQVYDISYSFSNFNPAANFQKWAAIEVTDFNSVPAGMSTFVLPRGLYAVFPYKGHASAGGQMFQYIFGVWLPASGYAVDDRPHFELLGEKYKNNDPDSEEEFWIPVKTKQTH